MSLRNCLIVVWVYVVYVFGTWLFISGYLMKHLVVNQNSSVDVYVGSSITCHDFSSLHTIFDEFNENLSPQTFKTTKTKNSHLQRFKRAVIVLIDALRYDFIVNSLAVENDAIFYLNKMPIVKKLTKKFPENAIVFQLHADPPTTTLQRLKGITTGSLPTFIDISRNFASSEIIEDNLIRQMKLMNKSIVFMGDDTWGSIFPNEFLRSYLYPSFNVKDLDTVDDGILDHIYEEITNEESDIIIAHFLGVDHCGHRYGPKHPEMSRKLSQMNKVIMNITKILTNNTLLLVLGDHGMTDTGDHGGDSINETSTVLFMYSPSKIIFTNNVDHPVISQIDIVPTLSLLLGLPIPFSNLGSIIPFLFTLNSEYPCFDGNVDALLGSALASAENALQINKYLKGYNNESQEIDDSLILALDDQLKNISSLWKNISSNITHNIELISEIQKGYAEYTYRILNLFKKKWLTFDLKYMVIGLISLCSAVLFNTLSAENINYTYLLTVSTVVGFISVNFILYSYFSSYLLFCIIFITSSIFMKIVMRFKTFFSDCFMKLLSVQSVVLLILFLCGFSNSFIIYEDRIILYLLQSVVFYRYTSIIISFFKHNFLLAKTKSSKYNQKFKYSELLLSMCLMFCIRLGVIFFKCREEQINCINTDFILSLEKMHMPQSYKILRLFVSLASIIIPVIIFLYISNSSSNSKNHAATSIIIRYGIFFVCVLTSLRWWLNVVSPDAVERILKGNEIILTRSAFFIGIIMSILLFLFPLLSEKPWTSTSKQIYSESMGTFLFIISQLLQLIAGDALSSAVTLMCASIFLHVLLDDLEMASQDHHLWINILIWNLLARYWFYATGHQASFSSIHWDAAFLFHHKEIYNYSLAGVLVILNTFSSYVLFGLAFPALLIWSRPVVCSNISIRRLHLKYILCFGTKLLGHCLAAFLLRHHLMAVKVFSPRLIYEVIGLIITMIASFIGHFFIVIVISQYHKLIRKNLGHMFSDKNE